MPYGLNRSVSLKQNGFVNIGGLTKDCVAQWRTAECLDNGKQGFVGVISSLEELQNWCS